MSSPPHPLMHFGMAGWFKIRNTETFYYKSSKATDPSEWPPKYWKFQLATASSPPVEAAFVDFRRFARIRLMDCPADEIRSLSPLKENGPDPVQDKEIVTEEWLAELLGRKHVPVKALLLDQANISGIGNWVGDELLYDAKVHPEQYSNTLTRAQITNLCKSIHYVCGLAVELLADSEKFPEGWLFKHRWGKGKKDAPKTLPSGAKITFLTVGGRTSAVIPSVQKKTGPVAGDVKTGDYREEDEKRDAPQQKGRRTPKKRKDTEKEEAAVDAVNVNDKGSEIEGNQDNTPQRRRRTPKHKMEVDESVNGTPNGEPSSTNKKSATKQEMARPAKKAKVEQSAEQNGRRRSARVSGQGV